MRFVILSQLERKIFANLKTIWCPKNAILCLSLSICCSFQLFQDLLDRPVENLLMNQANGFRETQEQREFLNQVLPLIHSGYVWHTFVFSGVLCLSSHICCSSTVTKIFKAFIIFSIHVCLYVYVLGLPCGQWVLESAPALWRWIEWHRSHSDSDRAGQTGTCHTCSTTKQHTPGIGYTQTPTVRRVPIFPFGLVLDLVPSDCAFIWNLVASQIK